MRLKFVAQDMVYFRLWLSNTTSIMYTCARMCLNNNPMCRLSPVPSGNWVSTVHIRAIILHSDSYTLPT